MSADGGGGLSEAMMEGALLDALQQKPHFVKAWLPDEGTYLLCNVDGFVVSYVGLSPPEVSR